MISIVKEGREHSKEDVWLGLEGGRNNSLVDSLRTWGVAFTLEEQALLTSSLVRFGHSQVGEEV